MRGYALRKVAIDSVFEHRRTYTKNIWRSLEISEILGEYLILYYSGSNRCKSVISRLPNISRQDVTPRNVTLPELSRRVECV
eukprot:440817-Amorphochlora_amoeboformis.AAC.1